MTGGRTAPPVSAICNQKQTYTVDSNRSAYCTVTRAHMTLNKTNVGGSVYHLQHTPVLNIKYGTLHIMIDSHTITNSETLVQFRRNILSAGC